MNKIEIPLSKIKIVMMLIGSSIFIVLGVLLITNSKAFVSPIMKNPEIIEISGLIAVCFFGLCLIFLVKKLYVNKIGLTIDQYGINDNTNATSVGLIEWGDITGIVKKQVMSNKFLILHVNNPEKYINRAKNIISRLAMNMNYKTYGSPISIISNSLMINFEDLEKLIMSEFEKRKNNKL